MRAFEPFERAPAIALGVSGGPDSMALALLLQAWVAAQGGQLLGLVVDHRLRPDSTVEAATVAERLTALGITSRVLTRLGPRPGSALQATARQARYALLEAAAAAAGILHLAVAHHQRDQAETIALRQASGSGSRGLAGMPAIRELERVRLIRPLLTTPPERLRATLVQRGVPWVEDPANRDPSFWRGRFRLAGHPYACDRAPDAAARQRQALDQRVATWLAAHGRPHPLGYVSIPKLAVADLDDAVLPALFARLAIAIGGGVWSPGQATLGRLRNWLHGGVGARLALGGVLVERGGAGMLRVVREPAAVAGPLPLAAADMLWDGRFRITWPSVPPATTVAAAGPGWRRRLAEAGAGRPAAAALPAVVLATLPLVSVAGRAVALGPWRFNADVADLGIAFRPRSRLADVPFGQTTKASVA